MGGVVALSELFIDCCAFDGCGGGDISHVQTPSVYFLHSDPIASAQQEVASMKQELSISISISIIKS